MKGIFLILSFSVLLWSLSLYFLNNPTLFNYQQWIKISFFLTILIIFNLLYFVINESNKSISKLKLKASLITFLIIFLVVLFENAYATNNYLKSFSPSFIILFLLSINYIGFAIIALITKFYKSNSFSQLRITFTLISFGIFMIIPAILYIYPSFKKYLWLGPLSSLLLSASLIIGYYFIREVEKRKESEKLVEEWKKLSQAKDQFLLSLQHHLRTPIMPLKGYLEGIVDGIYGREENPVIKEKLIEMKKITNTLYSLMESLLDVQQIKMGKNILNLEKCNINNIIKSIVEELKPTADQKGIYLNYEPGLNADFQINADKRKIREAIWNIVDNAVKYTNRGEVSIQTKIEDNKLQIKISDTGIGMEKEDINYFLEGKLFERGENAKKLYGPGRGIGLAIAVEFIKAHQGKIWAESKGWGNGTTFFIELPI